MKGVLGSLWKGLKMAFSATIGLPCACAATAILGVAFGLAYWTNAVEAKVKRDIFGQKNVHFSPFFLSVKDGIKGCLKSIWKDYGVYAHITLAEIALDKDKRQKLLYPEEKIEVMGSDKNPIMKAAASEKSAAEISPPVPTTTTIVPPPQVQTALPISESPNVTDKNLPIGKSTSTETINVPKPPAPPITEDLPPKNLDKDIVLESPSSSLKAVDTKAPFASQQNIPNGNQPSTAV
ncbi:MAG: hypothetical protein KGQ36_06600 [Rickettsiales bacterium]|nr:hypothetical protein [Rickettsiales bacterium]